MTKIDHYKSDAETPLSTQGAKRLLKLAAFLHELPKQKFDFSTFFSQGDKPPLEALAAGTHRCGTVGCAIGWMPAVWPRLVRWSVETAERWVDDSNIGGKFVEYEVAGMPELCDSGATGFELAQEFFDISYDDSHFLFDPSWGSDYDTARRNPLNGFASPKRVAAHIWRFVKRNYVGKATLSYE